MIKWRNPQRHSKWVNSFSVERVVKVWIETTTYHALDHAIPLELYETEKETADVEN